MSPTTFAKASKTAAAVGLPISWYFDPEVLEIERRELFAQGPTYAGRPSLAPNEGDYCVLGGQQKGRILVRNRGEHHLLSNVCRHRQAELLTGSGCAKNIVCPIHNWAYDLDGQQVAAPFFAENPCLDLPKTELTEWNGILFSGPRDVGLELAALDGWSKLADRDMVHVRTDEEEQDLNWKAYLEIYLEDYHIGAVHPGFRAFVDANEVKGGVHFANGELFHCEQVNVRWPLPPAGSPLFAEYQRVLLDVSRGKRPDFAAVWLCLFSGQLFEWYPYSLAITSYVPLSPTRTRLRTDYFFDREIAETRRDYVEIGLQVLDEVTGEDLMAAQKLQDGRRALHERDENAQGFYQMPMELGLRKFHDCLRSVVTPAL